MNGFKKYNTIMKKRKRFKYKNQVWTPLMIFLYVKVCLAVSEVAQW